MAEEKKIDFYKECKDLVQREVYCAITPWVDYIVKQSDFWENERDCPLVYDDIECKGWEKYDTNEDTEEESDQKFDYLCAYYVSDWLADELYNRGEFVARYKYTPCIWFRNACGQSICLDGVIDEIVRDLLVSRGECTEEEVKKLSIC